MAILNARWGVEIAGGLSAPRPPLVQDTTFEVAIEAETQFRGYVARVGTITFELSLQPNPDGYEAFATATDPAGGITFEISLEGSARGSFVHPLEFDSGSGGGGDVDLSQLGTMAVQDADDVDVTGGTLRNVTLINVTVDGGWFGS